jgi:hypothetical protein
MATIIRGLTVGVLGGALLVAAETPAAATPQGPVLSGTYDVVATYRSATVNEVMHIVSGCPQCDATATSTSGGTVALTWNGAGWQGTSGGGCGPMTSVITPVGNVNGFVQNFTTVATFLTPEVCAVTGPGTGTGTRIGD